MIQVQGHLDKVKVIQRKCTKIFEERFWTDTFSAKVICDWVWCHDPIPRLFSQGHVEKKVIILVLVYSCKVKLILH